MKLQLRIGSTDSVLSVYSRLLECIDEGNVSPNAVEKGINGMLERVASLLQGNAAMRSGIDASSSNNLDPQKLALAVYDSTLRVFHPSTGSCPNDRLWFKTNLKYGQLLYETNEATKLQQVLFDLQTTQEYQSNNDTTTAATHSSSSTQSLEIFALQMQLYSRQKDSKKLRQVFNKAMVVRGGIPHPRTIATIQELGGKMVSGTFFFRTFLLNGLFYSVLLLSLLSLIFILFCNCTHGLICFTYLYCSICKQKSTRLRAKLSFKHLRATTKREIKVVFGVSNT